MDFAKDVLQRSLRVDWENRVSTAALRCVPPDAQLIIYWGIVAPTRNVTVSGGPLVLQNPNAEREHVLTRQGFVLSWRQLFQMYAAPAPREMQNAIPQLAYQHLGLGAACGVGAVRLRGCGRQCVRRRGRSSK